MFHFSLNKYTSLDTFRTKPKELISMYSEALAIADKNTVKLMIDEMKEQVTNLTNEVAVKDQIKPFLLMVTR